MVTVVNNPGPNSNDSGAAGWAVAVVILLVVAGGLFWYFRYYRAAPAQAPGTTIQVNVPTGNTPAPAQ
ncbi:MAG: hypothetical protein AAB919_00040 [Patescibacteria group bacterium]